MYGPLTFGGSVWAGTPFAEVEATERHEFVPLGLLRPSPIRDAIRLALVVPLAVASGVQADPAWAQDTLVVSGAPECPACTVSFERVARLGAIDDPDGPADFAFVARAQDGSFYVSPPASYEGVLRYHADGSFAGRIGGRGEGPGEFGVPGPIAVGPDGRVHVFDGALQTWSVFGRDGAFVTSARLTAQVESALPLDDGSLLVNGEVQTADGIGRRLHHFDESGVSIRAFAGHEGAIDPRRRVEYRRIMGPASDGAVWLARPYRYQIERWHLDGTHSRTLTRDVDWFPAWSADTPRGDPRYLRPQTVILGVWEDDRARLWVVARTAAEDWSPVGPEPSPGQPRTMPPHDERDGYYDLIVEVIDLQTSRALTKLRVPHIYVQGVAGPGLIVARTGDGTGMVLVDIWQAALQ